MSIASGGTPGYSQLLPDWLGYKSEVPTTASLGSIRVALRFREALTYISQVIKGYDTDELPEEELHGVRSGMVPSAETSVPVELGCTTLPDVFAYRKFPKLPTIGNFMEASSCRHGQLLTQFPAPLSSKEVVLGWGAENSELLFMAWSFWWPAPI